MSVNQAVDNEGAKVCTSCHHFMVMHNKWGICETTACLQCRDEKVCERCGHTFINHTVSSRIVCCRLPKCNYVTCFSDSLEHRAGRPFRGRVKIENGMLVVEEADIAPRPARLWAHSGVQEPPRNYTVERKFA